MLEYKSKYFYWELVKILSNYFYFQTKIKFINNIFYFNSIQNTAKLYYSSI
jgi:hypothetical protein